MPPEDLRRNKQLTNFSGFKEIVISNVVKNVPSALKGKQDAGSEKSLLEFV